MLSSALSFKSFWFVPNHILNLFLASGNRMNMTTIRCYSKAIQLGSKYIYLTVPRVLTLWLDLGAQDNPDEEIVKAASKCVWRSFKASPRYKVRDLLFVPISRHC